MHAILLAVLLATLGNADVVKLHKAGLSAETIEAKIAASETSFDTSTDALVALAEAGIPDRVIKTMITRSPSPASPAKASRPATLNPPVSRDPGELKPAAPQTPTRRYDVAIHSSEHARCEGGELRIDSKGMKASRCGSKLDFELRWPDLTKVTYAYGTRGVLILETAKEQRRLSTTTPAEAKKIVEHIQAAAPGLVLAAE